jgi:hypothetical protein
VDGPVGVDGPADMDGPVDVDGPADMDGPVGVGPVGVGLVGVGLVGVSLVGVSLVEVSLVEVGLVEVGLVSVVSSSGAATEPLGQSLCSKGSTGTAPHRRRPPWAGGHPLTRSAPTHDQMSGVRATEAGTGNDIGPHQERHRPRTWNDIGPHQERHGAGAGTIRPGVADRLRSSAVVAS